MSLTTGSRLGPYEIVARLGAGEIGEVYRGRGTKLNPDVAIKILIAGVATNSDRLARLRREAQVLTACNHSNIAQIYGPRRVWRRPRTRDGARGRRNAPSD